MNRTIHDIARELGVSARTVSRVLNEKPGVSPETRARVETYIADVGFQPHSGARSLRKARDDCIGVLLPAPPDEVRLHEQLLYWLFSELYRVFAPQGAFISFDLNPPLNHTGRPEYARGVWQHRYGACVLAGPLAIGDSTICRLHETGLPYLALGRLDSLPQCSCATVDYVEAAVESVAYLVKRGHRRIAMLSGFEGYQPGRERLQGYLRGHAVCGLPVDENLYRTVPFEKDALINTAHRLLLDKSVTAVIDCCGWEDAQGLREGLERAGRRAGEDTDLIVWTYTRHAVVMAEAVAHMWIPVQAAASEGLELLADWLYGRRAGPFQRIYRPVIYEPEGREITRPRPLFTTDI
jgi:LacI family transcriptional regulator